LVSYHRDDDWPLHLSLQVVPGGGLVLILDPGGEVLHRTITHSDTGRADVLRVTYSWDVRNRCGQLALERTDQDRVFLLSVSPPRPLRYAGALALIRPSDHRYVVPDVLFFGAVHGHRTGWPDAVVADARHAHTATPKGETVPVLHVLNRQMPASGSFHTVRLRAIYFGLLQDITVAPSQRLVLSGPKVEYLFGLEPVLVTASLLAGLDRHSLPEHGKLTPPRLCALLTLGYQQNNGLPNPVDLALPPVCQYGL
jgi:hypothetical protein